MTWVGWRQQRTETLIAVAILAAIAALLVPTGLQMISAYHRDGIAACLAHQDSQACGGAIGSFMQRFEPLGNLMAWLTIVPGLVGALLAAPFVLDLENGTYRLLWTQSITRRQWIAGKLGLAAGAALVTTLVVTLLLTWWRAPLVRVNGRMDNSAYDVEGIVPLAYALFALGLGLAIGAIWRRAVPALVAAFGAYFAARVFVDTTLRQHLISPVTKTWRDMGPQPAVLNHAWVLSEHTSDRFGNAIAPSGPPCGPGCRIGAPDGGYMHAVFHPASHFWAMQGIESALFGGVGLALLALAAWWTLRRAG